MTWLEFIAKMTSSIAWPIALIAIVVIFKKPISFVISSVGKIKYKDLELDFASLKELAEGISPQEPPTLPRSPEQRFFTSLEEQIADIVSKSPAGAVLLSWTAVETAISTTVARLAISADEPSSRSLQNNLMCLRRNTDLSPEVFKTIDRLRTLRNQIAHDYNSAQSISENDAVSYGQSAVLVIEALNGACFPQQKAQQTAGPALNPPVSG